MPALVITKGGPQNATLLPLYADQNGFEFFRFGDAAMLSAATFLLTLAMVWVQWRVLRRWRSGWA